MTMRNLLIALLLLSATPVLADSDHDRARAAKLSGQAKPLSEVVRLAETQFDGRLLEAELEDEHGRLIYELEMLTPQGHRIELIYDAQSLELLKTEGRGVAEARKP